MSICESGTCGLLACPKAIRQLMNWARLCIDVVTYPTGGLAAPPIAEVMPGGMRAVSAEPRPKVRIESRERAPSH